MFSSIAVRKSVFNLCANNSYSYESSLSTLRNALFSSGYNLFSSDCLNNYPIGESTETVVREKSEKVEKVKTLLRNYGFTDTHISKMAKMVPYVFSRDPENTLSPKLDFLHSIGVSKADIPKTIVHDPPYLGRSLEKQIIPCYNFLKSVPLSDELLVVMITRNLRILGFSVEKIASNIEASRQVGVPQSHISFLLSQLTSAVLQNHERFKKSLVEAMKMGFNPLERMFVHAVQILCTTTKSTWDLKFDVFRRFGLSDDEILLAFRLHPTVMSLSEEKIVRGMNFYINVMKCKPAAVVRHPIVLDFSMEKRIIPRCRVIMLLVQKGFLKQNYRLTSFLMCTDEYFICKFVDAYKDNLPQLKDVYNQGMVCSGRIGLDPIVVG